MLPENEIQVRVRYQECDPMGLLHHATYLVFFEMGRTELLRAGGRSYRRVEEEGLHIVVAKIDCRYYRPARYDDLLKVHTRLTRMTGAKMEHEYRVLRDGELLAVGHATLAVVDRSGRVQRIPHWMRAPPQGADGPENGPA